MFGSMREQNAGRSVCHDLACYQGANLFDVYADNEHRFAIHCSVSYCAQLGRHCYLVKCQT